MNDAAAVRRVESESELTALVNVKLPFGICKGGVIFQRLVLNGSLRCIRNNALYTVYCRLCGSIYL